jgi:hypothetical protein
MDNAMHIRTRVLPGSRIEVDAPGLPEGEEVDVFLVASGAKDRSHPSILEFLDSLPPGPRSYPTWEEVEKHFQEERESWDR